jgi:anti-sigma-K factor RskA
VVSLTGTRMNDGSLHELSAAYALDALDDADRRSFEAHLAGCPRCREDVASFRETAAALARDAEPLAPPEALERRILTAARSERSVLPLRQRWVAPAAGIAAVAAAVAIGLGIWGIRLSDSLDRERSAHARDARVIAILSQSGARQIPTKGGSGLLVVAPTRRAVLVANGLTPAGPGKTYEAWVVDGKIARPAGLFHGGAGSKVVELTEPVGPGATVGVTVEKAGGSKTPTGGMVLRATA